MTKYTAFFLLSLAVAMAVLISLPDKWDKAVAIKVCGGLPIVRQENGSVWLRYHWRAYRVENWEGLC